MRPQIQRLQQLLEQLVLDAKAVDEQNRHRRSHYYLQQQALFDDKLFNRSYDTYSGYIPEIQKKLNHLQTLLDHSQQDLAYSLLEQLQLQISSLITAIKANDSRHRDSDYRLQRRQRISSQKARSITAQIIRPSRELYEKLAEYQGFEKRLEQMLFDAQDELKRAPAQSSELQTKVLTLHQRLGRCRQAIAKLEVEIEKIK
ncbi:primosomal replication protein PriC [Thalassotalea mangrovi]|uniref:Primosomal replication protein N n=1 Tax=Thalassotalea mangrovi TaxID=2572245 RepID=A0A4U1B446_9GAMM|nr:primosomal replication protein PriC [Thalassotalea mangrovi]TKB44682.1 hypothetical protein E8M12_11125 [Thalassotalea mangrovi]